MPRGAERPGTEIRLKINRPIDLNFGSVDLEFVPDGSLYVTDLQNALTGHLQHSSRDVLLTFTTLGLPTY